MSYAIKRFYERDECSTEMLGEGLTLEEAQAWCSDPETSSATCSGVAGTLRTSQKGAWFEGLVEE